MPRKVATPDSLIAEIAERQHGAVSVGQLRRSGLGDEAIRARVDSGRLHRIHRAVYAVGHAALPPEGRWQAAVLALGGGPSERGHAVLDRWEAAVSHRSAASLWNLLPVTSGPADVIVSGDGGRARRSGIRVHRSRSLAPCDVTLRRGIPVTTPARTIADLRKAIAAGKSPEEAAMARGPGIVTPRELRKAIRQANVLGLPVDDESVRDRTRSDLERDFMRLCRRNRLPLPEINVGIGPFLVDFLWKERRLVVETDGYTYHRGRAAFQDDRDLELRRLGYDVLRLSERQIDEEPDRVAETLAATLGHRRPG